ncbi:MAG: 3-dehydroquinate synthase [Candidatus Gracilibacteria bacterium]|nr:3-dehydroquinate synthase [bacterium]MDZ4217182.1 3-dehydroquinate synthase [Candidatus Gracilibacteria bacterium]
MRRIQLQLKKSVDDSYDIVVEKGILRRLGSDLRMKRYAESYVVITDSKVGRLYASKLVDQLKREKLFLGKIVVPAGESSKSLEQLKDVLDQMVKMGANRETGVIALGGGVVGDLGGFAAASFMRGVPYIQIPTTLLAMVDSSVGGKVGVDLPSGKNLVGAFWQPKKVYIDPELLSTLSQKQWKAGLGEAVKYGAIKDRSLWEYFEQHVKVWNKDPKSFLPGDYMVIEEMIERCVQIKADVVMKDEREGNLRQILNYGHTFGHVIELMSDFKVLHGEVVASGMRIAAELANRLRFLSDAELKKHNDLLDVLNIGKAKTQGLIKEFVQHMRKDKKAKGTLRVVLVDRIGRCHQELGNYGMRVDEKLIAEVLKEGKWVNDLTSDGARVRMKDSSLTSSPVSSISWGNTYQSPSESSPDVETDLQRRLREMRERAEERRRMGGSGG